MIDQEFHMVREPAVARCEDTDAVKLWRTDHKFQSRWIVGGRLEIDDASLGKPLIVRTWTFTLSVLSPWGGESRGQDRTALVV